MVPIAELKFADYNPRTISEENFLRLRKSIKEFGFTVPCTINSHEGRENILIAGHMRTRAAQEEGMQEVPCWVVSLPPAKEKLLNIALNNPNLQGEYNQDMLMEMVSLLKQEGEDVSLTGFRDDEIVKLTDEQVGLNMPELTDEDTEVRRITVYYASSVMEEVEAVLKKWPGKSVSEKFLALVRAAANLPVHGPEVPITTESYVQNQDDNQG